MWQSLIASAIAVVGTLVGTWSGGFQQLRRERAQRRENRAEDRRAEALNAVTGLVAALANHRRAMWQYEDARIAVPERVKEARTNIPRRDAVHQGVTDLQTITHDTRAAITVPLTTVAILAPGLADAARKAAQATYAMRNADSVNELELRRAAAVDASEQLVTAAAEFFSSLGVVVA